MSETPSNTGRLELAAALLAASLLGAPLVIASAVQAVLFSIQRPAAVWVGGEAPGFVIGFAALTAFLVSFAGILVALALVFARLKSRPDARTALRLPLMILLAQLVFGALAVGLVAITPGILA